MAHVPMEELAERLEEAGREVEVGARYVHYKDASHEYIVRALVIIEATEGVGVVYEAQYGPEPRISFMRPLDDFCAIVDVDGAAKPRFAKVAGKGRIP